MTDKQKFHFFFPAWSAAVEANGWHIKNKRAVVNEELRDAPPEVQKIFSQVLTFARERARKEYQPMTLDHLRHGCYIRCLGKDRETAQLSNKEMDRIVCLFHVFEDPLWLGTDEKSGWMHWLMYERGEDPGSVRRVEYVIRSIPDQLARSIAADMLHTKNWELLPLAQKHILARRIGQYRDEKQTGLTKFTGFQTAGAGPEKILHNHVHPVSTSSDPELEPF